MRPLPELTLANEWFWTSGDDGVLRIQGCATAATRPPARAHLPLLPQPVAKPAPVSGRGTVVGFTVNAHRWLPDFDPPYVVANVALAEDARVHLTTNIVGCEPADVRIGQEVAVRFEQHEDVWLPLFEPTGRPRPGRPGRRAGATAPRAPLGDERFEHRAVLSGIGRSSSAAGSWSTPCRWPSTPAWRRSLTPGSRSRTSTGCRPTPALAAAG